MFLERNHNSGEYINLYNVLFVRWDKKRKVEFELMDGTKRYWDYATVQKAQDDIDIIERIIKKSIYFDE